jgi:OOP family OmpA-OmpF porin
MTNMKKLIILSIGLLLAAGVCAQDEFNAMISVTNFDDKPIEKMSVQLLNVSSKKTRSGITDPSGSFNLKMTSGKYIVKLYKGEELLKESAIEIPELDGRRIYNKVTIQVLYEDRTVFTLDDLHFDYNSAVIKNESFGMLDRLAEYLKSEQGVQFEIAGHTDSDGSDADNLTLSNKRATAVKDYLVKRGVPASQLKAKGYGEKEPIADNSTAEGKAKNRRTEIRRIG